MQKRSTCTKSLALQVRCKHLGKRGFVVPKARVKKKKRVHVREISGVDVEQGRVASSAGSLGGGGVLFSPPRPSFKGSLFIGTSCSGPGVKNLSFCFIPVVVKPTS